MQGNHPKRRYDKDNPYRICELEGKYYLTFKDGQNNIHEMEISKELHDTFDTFELEDNRQRGFFERHMEQSDVWDYVFDAVANSDADSLEDTVIRNLEYEQLHKAMEKLTEVQKKRLHLYYFRGLTYKEIAEIEGCSIQSVRESICGTLEKIKNIFKMNP